MVTVQAPASVQPAMGICSFQTPPALREGQQRYSGAKIPRLRIGALPWVFQEQIPMAGWTLAGA